MFFVVRLIDIGVEIVIPQIWIRNGEKILERYMFYGIKNDQRHLCYYSVQDGATILINGKMIPNENFVPNFRAQLSVIFPFDGSIDEGVFNCRIFAFKGQYEFAKMNSVSSESGTTESTFAQLNINIVFKYIVLILFKQLITVMRLHVRTRN